MASDDGDQGQDHQERCAHELDLGARREGESRAAARSVGSSSGGATTVTRAPIDELHRIGEYGSVIRPNCLHHSLRHSALRVSGPGG